jgi:hypothetical protein
MELGHSEAEFTVAQGCDAVSEAGPNPLDAGAIGLDQVVDGPELILGEC